MSENKTKPTKLKAIDFIATIKHQGKRNDALYLLELMGQITGVDATLLGPNIIGFGR
ncbi:MAG: hypothetical protein ACI9J3_002998 [Parvicellaceae bacterium]|jgi:hypothetical protein